MTRVTLCIFVVLTALFMAAVAALHHWGGHWAANAYRPLLVEKAESAFNRQQAGEAERVLVQALRTTPAYAPDIIDLARDYLPVMPELAHALPSEMYNDFSKAPTTVESPSSEQDPYRRAAADLAIGNRQQARDAFAELVNKREALPDSAYQLGVCYEQEQNPRGALECYALALQSSCAHLDAAQAYLRLTKRE